MNSKVIASFSPYRPGFDSQLFRVKFVANKEALRQVSSPSTLFFIPPYHYHSGSAPYSSVTDAVQTSQLAITLSE